MAITITKLFPPGALPTSTGTLYTATGVVKNGRIRLTNTTGAAIAVTMYAVPSGGSAATSNVFMGGKSVPQNDYLDTDIPVLASGDTLQGVAMATGITYHLMDGVVYTP